MHEVAPYIAGLRRRLRALLPRKWLEVHPVSSAVFRARRPAQARMELDAESPATSWVAWEISRPGRPAG